MLEEFPPCPPVGRIWAFVECFCEVMKAEDNAHARTVGVKNAGNLRIVNNWVDVFTFHDYRSTRQKIKDQLVDGIASMESCIRMEP